ncbi:hypothetical protein Pelo_15333 [Pelomyxa schiedti]|nr:hypothetical protein Pelo_15333 [Pelomyxa schiedti]
MAKLGLQFCRSHIVTRLPLNDMERDLLMYSPAYSGYSESSPKSSYGQGQEYQGFWMIGTTPHGRLVFSCVDYPPLVGNYLPLKCKSWLVVCNELDRSIDPATVLRLSTNVPLTADNCCLVNETETSNRKKGYQGRLYLRVFVKCTETSDSWVRTPMCIVTDPSIEFPSEVHIQSPGPAMGPASGFFYTYPATEVPCPSLDGSPYLTSILPNGTADVPQSTTGVAQYTESDYTPLPLYPYPGSA